MTVHRPFAVCSSEIGRKSSVAADLTLLAEGKILSILLYFQAARLKGKTI